MPFVTGAPKNCYPKVPLNSLALSVWSPPYFVGKEIRISFYFRFLASVTRNVISLHYPIVKPGGFLVINIADILCFKDPSIWKIQAEVIRHRRSVTRQNVVEAMHRHPRHNRYQIAALLGCRRANDGSAAQ